LDGNPLSLQHFQDLDNTITEMELEELVKLKILKKEYYSFTINQSNIGCLTDEESFLISLCDDNILTVDKIKVNRSLKIRKIPISNTINRLIEKNVLTNGEERYDFKNTKISTGLYGVNRIFLPTSNIFPTLVASDTNDFVTTTLLNARSEAEHKKQFIELVYKRNNYRRITKEEACLIQGFPENYILPENRAKWMRLVGNSVSVPVIEILCKAILDTGVFDRTTETKFDKQKAHKMLPFEINSQFIEIPDLKNDRL
jgi:DNA (cytosine-5)-methyltransferase 1